jgi:hypothetical protein
LNIEVFCYVGLLRFPEQLEPSLELLPELDRAKAEEFLASVKGWSRSQLLQGWASLRGREALALRQRLQSDYGIELEKLAPIARRWCLERLIYQDGRKDHQR